jgi:hypothetical protein
LNLYFSSGGKKDNILKFVGSHHQYEEKGTAKFTSLGKKKWQIGNQRHMERNSSCMFMFVHVPAFIWACIHAYRRPTWNWKCCIMWQKSCWLRTSYYFYAYLLKLWGSIIIESVTLGSAFFLFVFGTVIFAIFLPNRIGSQSLEVHDSVDHLINSFHINISYLCQYLCNYSVNSFL